MENFFKLKEILKTMEKKSVIVKKYFFSISLFCLKYQFIVITFHILLWLNSNVKEQM